MSKRNTTISFKAAMVFEGEILRPSNEHPKIKAAIQTLLDVGFVLESNAFYVTHCVDGVSTSDMVKLEK